ncbi:MAG TPA: type II secretion system protein [Longimicrobium sp.]|nr:type II secretion system protein [Longimicrobium sp.]
MSSAELKGARGFTLIEVMVALLLAGVLATVIFQIVRGQARFATVQSAQQEVQQNARGAIEIIASELRGVQPAGLISTSRNSITFLLPRVWGVACGGAGGTTLNAVFPDVPNATDVMFAVNTASGLLGDTARAGASQWAPIPDAGNLNGRAQVNSLPALNPGLGVAGSACDSVRTTAPAAGLLRAVTVTGSSLPRVPAGNTVYLYQLARYEVATATTGGERWIYRSQGLPGTTGSSQQLAGPLASDTTTGLVFTYFRSNGTQFTPGSSRADLLQVARIGIKVAARSRNQGRANLTDSVTTSVLLRNLR